MEGTLGRDDERKWGKFEKVPITESGSITMRLDQRGSQRTVKVKLLPGQS